MRCVGARRVGLAQPTVCPAFHVPGPASSPAGAGWSMNLDPPIGCARRGDLACQNMRAPLCFNRIGVLQASVLSRATDISEVKLSRTLTRTSVAFGRVRLSRFREEGSAWPTGPRATGSTRC